MGLLARLWAWLKAPTSRRLEKSHPDLSPIDVDKLTRELDLVDQGRRLGAAGLPAQDATTSGPESAIIQRVEKARQDYVDWAVLRLSVLSQSLMKNNVTQDVNRALQADQEFERKAASLFTERENLLRQLGATAESRKKELHEFRRHNSLSREAIYPTFSGEVVRYLVLVLLVLLEGLLNAKFFASGLSTGLIGGLTEAGIAAGINVLVAFTLGRRWIRYSFHVRLPVRLFGLAGVLLSIATTVALGLGIAHYRDALTSELASPASVALQTLLATPFQLKDVFSWLLSGVSMLFAVIALLDGLSLDDLYPGYGPISRRTTEAIDAYEDELNSIRTELETLKSSYLEELDETATKSQACIASSNSLIEDKRTAGLRLLTALRDADHSLEALLQRFRSENQLHRGGVPRPTYFDKPAELRPLRLPDLEVQLDTAALDVQRELVERLLSEVEAIRARIQAAFTQQFDRIKPLGTHFIDGETT